MNLRSRCYTRVNKKERTALNQEMIGHPALEAEFRGVGIGELMTQLIVAAIEKDMFKAMLDESSGAEILDLHAIRQNDPQQNSIASLKPLSADLTHLRQRRASPIFFQLRVRFDVVLCLIFGSRSIRHLDMLRIRLTLVMGERCGAEVGSSAGFLML
jgi:hypothetical protein